MKYYKEERREIIKFLFKYAEHNVINEENVYTFNFEQYEVKMVFNSWYKYEVKLYAMGKFTMLMFYFDNMEKPPLFSPAYDVETIYKKIKPIIDKYKLKEDLDKNLEEKTTTTKRDKI